MRRFFVATIGVALIAGSALAQGQIFGRITRTGGVSLSGVSVTIGETGLTRTTDQNGTYRMTGLPPGDYTLILTMSDNFEQIDGVPVTAGTTTVMDYEVDWEVNFAETITVFAANREVQRVVDAPAAVTIVTNEEIERQATHGQLPKVLEFSAGSDVSQGGLYDYNFNARGFNSTLNRRILVLVDGRDPAGTMLGAQNWAVNFVPLDDLEGMEFVRGPGSALYGANAYNGVLNITTKNPKYHPGGNVRLAGGELATIKLDFRHAAVAGNGWSWKVTGSFVNSDDWSRDRTPATGGEYPGVPLEAIPVLDIDNELKAVAFRVDKEFDNGMVITTEGGQATVEGTLVATGIGRVQVEESDRPWARFNINMPSWNFLAYYDARDSTNRSLASGAQLIDDSFKMHFELQGNTAFNDGKVRLVGGISHREEDAESLGTIINSHRQEDQQAVFGQLDWKISDQLTGVFAARWDDSTRHEEQISPKASLVWAWNDTNSIRVSYNEAFQTPNYLEWFLQIQVAPPTSALYPIEQALAPFLGGVPLNFDSIQILALGNDDLEVETNTTIELGYTGILGGKALVHVDLYQSTLDNFVTDLLPNVNPDGSRVNSDFLAYAPPSELAAQVQAIILATLAGNLPPELLAIMSNDPVTGLPIFAALSYTNAGEVDLHGIEVSLGYYFATNWTFDFSSSWFDFDVKEELFEGQLQPNSPEFRVKFGISYAGDKWDSSLRMRWSDEFIWSTGVFDGVVPSYEVFDLSGNYQLTDNIDIGLNISNLVDKEHYQSFGGDLLGRRALAHLGFSW